MQDNPLRVNQILTISVHKDQHWIDAFSTFSDYFQNSLTFRTKNKVAIYDLFQYLDNMLKIKDSYKTFIAQLQQNP